MPSPVPYDLPPKEERVEISRIIVSRAEQQKLQAIARATGRPQLWHRREGLRLYLDLFNDDGSRR